MNTEFLDKFKPQVCDELLYKNSQKSCLLHWRRTNFVYQPTYINNFGTGKYYNGTALPKSYWYTSREIMKKNYQFVIEKQIENILFIDRNLCEIISTYSM